MAVHHCLLHTKNKKPNKVRHQTCEEQYYKYRCKTVTTQPHILKLNLSRELDLDRTRIDWATHINKSIRIIS